MGVPTLHHLDASPSSPERFPRGLLGYWSPSPWNTYPPPAVTDGFGNLNRVINFPDPPTGWGPGEITPGSTWNFQFWFRDPSGGPAGFNFSDGLEVTFCA